MAIVTEDGTGLSTAQSYVSVSDSDDIAERLLLSPQDWTGLEEKDKEIYLVRATLTLDTKNRWISEILETDQALGFPRKEFKDREGRKITGVPNIIKESTLMLAAHEAINGEPAFSNQPSVVSESYGNTSITYGGPIKSSEGEAYIFMKKLRQLGYAASSSVIDLYRA